MKRLLTVLVFALPLVLFAVPSEAQMRWGVRAGIVDEDPMIGAELLFPVGAGFVINPNLEFTSDAFLANADAHFDFNINRNTAWWVGAGLAFINPDSGDDGFEGGINFLAGVGGQRGRWYPYAQAKYTSAGDIDDFGSIAVGLRF